MQAPPVRAASERVLVIAFAGLLLAFLISTMVVHRVSSDVRTLAGTLVETVIPRIDRIAELRTSALETQLALAELVAFEPGDRAQAERRLDTQLRELEAQVAAAGQSPELVDALVAFEAAVREARTLNITDPRAARRVISDQVLRTGSVLGELEMRELERSATRGRGIALEIARARERAIELSYVLVIVCVAIAIAGVIVVRRDTDRRFSVVRAQARHQHERAEELEHFAGRVAHDIRGPIATAALATEMLGIAPESRRGELVTRIDRGLSRATSIIDALLEFARAGARPDPGARTEVREVLDDLATGLVPELAAANIELTVEPPPAVLVACSTGVYLSLLGNLVRNAMKYMGDASERRITVRVIARATAVVTEVIDTGPGVPRELLPSLFEPYFRAGSGREGGLGLGLATVRKLTLGHGGDTGVRSELGRGSTFWFELPRH